MKNLLLLPFVFYLSLSSYACLNEYGYKLDGSRIQTRYLYLSKNMLTFNESDIQKRLDVLSRKVKNNNKDFKTWSDIAVNLMKLGQVDSALHILQPIVYQNPTEYKLIANLGTAYELTGNIDSALFYISKGIDTNPESHFGSEWVHKAILEAKLKIKSNKNWLNSHSILDYNDLLNRVKNDGKRGRKTERVNQQIIHQIRTRAPFTPAPNKVLANILTTLGDFNTEVGTYENAILAYSYAMSFESPDIEHAVLKSKIKELNQKRINSEKDIENMPHAFKKMYKRSIFDPELLFLGLEDFAEEQEMFESEFQIKNDSIHQLKTELAQNKSSHLSDLKSTKKTYEKTIQTIKKSQKTDIILYFIGGFIFGSVVFFLLGRKKF